MLTVYARDKLTLIISSESNLSTQADPCIGGVKDCKADKFIQLCQVGRTLQQTVYFSGILSSIPVLSVLKCTGVDVTPLGLEMLS
jgi:hypothetical protein